MPNSCWRWPDSQPADSTREIVTICQIASHSNYKIKNMYLGKGRCSVLIYLRKKKYMWQEAVNNTIHKCSQKSLLFEKLRDPHRAQSRKEIKQRRMISPSFPREKLTKVYGNIGIFFSRWRLTFQRWREKRRVNSGEGCIERRGETVRGVCQSVFVDAAVCGAGRPEGGGHSRGGFALSEEGVQKVTCVWGVQALSGNIKHRSSNPLVTFL